MRFILNKFFSKIAKKKLFLLLAVLVFGTVLPLQLGSAASLNPIDWMKDGIVDNISAVILFVPFLIIYLFYFISSVFPIIAGSLLNWVINLDVLLTRCEVPGTCAVDIGWAFTRDLANIFFILFLVIIAFATILKIESYGMRRLLPVLIMVALLINFSQLFVGVIVDFWNALTGFFISKLTGIDTYTSGVIETTSVVWGDVFSGGVKSVWSNMSTVIELLVMGIFNLILGFMLAFYFLIFFMRIPMLWMLTILAPIYFVCAIIPYTKGKFTQWIKWVFEWASIGFWASLYLYLGLFVITSATTMGIDKSTLTIPAGGDITGGLESLIQSIIPYILAIAFLALGAMSSFQTNTLFSSAVVGGAAAMYGKYVSAQSWGKRLGTDPARKYAAKPAMETKEKAQKGAKSAALWSLGSGKKAPLFMKTRYEEDRRMRKEKKSKEIEELSRKYGDFSPETQSLIAKKKYIPYVSKGTAEKNASALAIAAAKHGTGDKISASMKEGEWEKVVEKGALNLREIDKKQYKEMLRNAPQYAQADSTADPEIGTTKEAQTIEAFGSVPPSFWREESNKESFEFLGNEKNEKISKEIVKNFSVEKLKNFSKIQNERIRDDAQKTIGNLLGQVGNELSDSVKAYLEESKEGKAWMGYIDLKSIESPVASNKKGEGREERTRKAKEDKYQTKISK